MDNLEDNSKEILINTGRSFSVLLILESTIPQYDKRLFIELQVQHMITSDALNFKVNTVVIQYCFYFEI